MRVDSRPPHSPAGEQETVMAQVLRAADRLSLLTVDWYPNEYRFISEELFAALLELRTAAGKLPPGR